MPFAAPQGYYAKDADPLPQLNRLRGTVSTEICIIGGGYTGLSAALHMARAGAAPLLIEAEQIGFGASGRNGGQIHPGQRQDQPTLERWLGVQHARDLWCLAEEAVALVRVLAADAGVPVREGLITAAHDGRALAALQAGSAHLARHYGVESQLLDIAEIAIRTGTPFYRGGRLEVGGGHVQPLQLARGLARLAENAGARLYERTRALRIETSESGVVVRCANAEIRAEHVLVACDAWIGALLPQLAAFVAPVESYLIATEPLPPELRAAILPDDPAVADTRHVLDYYRKSHDGRLLFSGGESYLRPPRNIAALVRPRMLAVFPELRNLRIDYAWSGTVGITRTRMPHFGRCGRRVLFAHGYSGHGVALAMLGGRLMAEAAMGESERFDCFARVPAERFPGGPLLRRPLVAGALLAYRLMDAI